MREFSITLLKEWKYEYIIRNNLYDHHFQPIFHLLSKKISGYEGLLRVKKLTSPELLFKKAIQVNDLLTLDMASIEKVLQTFSQTLINKYQYAKLFVNIFPSTIISSSFYKQFQSMLERYHIGPESIVFELNELEEIEHFSILRESIEQLRQLQVEFALDDFGIGVSSLKKTIELEPEYVKFDKYFAKNLSRCSKKQQLLQSIMQYFSKNKTKVIIEGIEKEADAEVAQALGIQFGQGYLLGKPKGVEYFL